eukprot:1471969-Rhodomonas_salina.1
MMRAQRRKLDLRPTFSSDSQAVQKRDKECVRFGGNSEEGREQERTRERREQKQERGKEGWYRRHRRVRSPHHKALRSHSSGLTKANYCLGVFTITKQRALILAGICPCARNAKLGTDEGGI